MALVFNGRGCAGGMGGGMMAYHSRRGAGGMAGYLEPLAGQASKTLGQV